MKIAFIPIDNRPVCYTLPKLIAQIDESFELVLPERELLGDLTKQANVEALFEWIQSLTDVDTFVIALDTIAYGGLISSRRCPETFDDIKLRLDKLKTILTNKKVFAFSSIMRISNNNINEEEKPYWDKWGKKIFEYSWLSHKDNSSPSIEKDIPAEILKDYTETRKRNFEINKIYLNWQKEGIFDTLIFSKDDCAEFGFNVQEANELQALGGTIKTGADEIPLTLLAKALDGEYTINPIFTEPNQTHLISNYEDISIGECVKNQIELAGFKLAETPNADINLLVNNFAEHQGEIVMKTPTSYFDKKLEDFIPFNAIADVRFANGADNKFIEQLFKTNKLQNILCYSGWNTSANSHGCLMLSLKMILNAKSKKTFNKCAYNKLMLTRFLDDWAFQANVRQTLNEPKIAELTNLMQPYQNTLLNYFPINDKINYKFPWNRLFEVEIEFI